MPRTVLALPSVNEAGNPEPTVNRAVQIRDVSFSWTATQPNVVEIPHLAVEPREKLFLSGPSGSGKSTLLSLLSGVITPQHGEIRILDNVISSMSASRRDRFRADHIGYIFQMFNLVPYLTVVENITLPLRFSKRRWRKAGGREAPAEAVRLLQHLGMTESDLLRRPVTEMSVGQQQRVAAARALIGCPELVIADEPTSSLDAENREAFIQLLFQECEREGTTLIFVSHDRSLAGMFDRVEELGAGVECRVSGVEKNDALPESRKPKPDAQRKAVTE